MHERNPCFHVTASWSWQSRTESTQVSTIVSVHNSVPLILPSVTYFSYAVLTVLFLPTSLRPAPYNIHPTTSPLLSLGGPLKAACKITAAISKLQQLSITKRKTGFSALYFFFFLTAYIMFWVAPFLPRLLN